MYGTVSKCLINLVRNRTAVFWLKSEVFPLDYKVFIDFYTIQVVADRLRHLSITLALVYVSMPLVIGQVKK